MKNVCCMFNSKVTLIAKVKPAKFKMILVTDLKECYKTFYLFIIYPLDYIYPELVLPKLPSQIDFLARIFSSMLNEYHDQSDTWVILDSQLLGLRFLVSVFGFSCNYKPGLQFPVATASKIDLKWRPHINHGL